MATTQQDLDNVGVELDMLEHTLGVLVDSAKLDGEIDADEQASIDEMEQCIRAAKRRRDELKAELNPESNAAAGSNNGNSASEASDDAPAASRDYTMAKFMPGSGGYVYAQFPDGEIVIMEGPHGEKELPVKRGSTAWDAITKEIGPYNAPAETETAAETTAEAPPPNDVVPVVAASPDIPLITELQEREVALIQAYQNASSEAEADAIWDELEGVREEISDEMIYAAGSDADTPDVDNDDDEELPEFHVDGAPDSEFADAEPSEANPLTKDQAEALGLKEWVQGFAIALSLLTGHGDSRPAGETREEAEVKEEAGHRRKRRKKNKKGGGGKGGSGGKGGGGGRGGGGARGAAGRGAAGRAGASRAGGGQAVLVQLSWEVGYAAGREVAKAAGEEEYHKGVTERTYMSDAEFERRMRDANPLPFLPDNWPRWFDWH